MKRKKSNGSFSVWNAVLGSGISVAGYLLLTAAVAAMVLEGRISVEGSGWAVRGAAILGALLGGTIAAKINNENTLMTCIMVAGVSLLIEFSLSMLVLNGTIQKPIILGVTVCLASAAGVGLGSFRRKAGKRRKRTR